MAVRKKTEQGAEPLMAMHEAKASQTRTRRNAAADIPRTDRFRNIENGMIPFKYSHGVTNNSNIDIRDTIILCQKAYYNFSVFRNTIDLMTEFSISDLYYTGGSKKSRDFFETLLTRINIDDLQSRFFREYYRSGNVFVYRFNAKMDRSDALKLNQTFGLAEASDDLEIPSKYIILNPSDIQLQGSVSFSTGIYYKVVTEYELQRLRFPQTEEDREVFDRLPQETKKLIENTKKVLEERNLHTISLDFYSGVLFALQRSSRSGLEIDLSTFDTENNKLLSAEGDYSQEATKNLSPKKAKLKTPTKQSEKIVS